MPDFERAGSLVRLWLSHACTVHVYTSAWVAATAFFKGGQRDNRLVGCLRTSRPASTRYHDYYSLPGIPLNVPLRPKAQPSTISSEDRRSLWILSTTAPSIRSHEPARIFRLEFLTRADARISRKHKAETHLRIEPARQNFLFSYSIPYPSFSTDLFRLSIYFNGMVTPSARLNTRDRLYHCTVSLYRQTHIFLHFYK